jgi:hypothetical protein
MNNFKISPFTQGKPTVPKRSWSRFLLLILLLIMIIETMSFGYWIFRLNAQIAELEQRIEIIQASEKGDQVDV